MSARRPPSRGRSRLPGAAAALVAALAGGGCTRPTPAAGDPQVIGPAPTTTFTTIAQTIPTSTTSTTTIAPVTMPPSTSVAGTTTSTTSSSTTTTGAPVETVPRIPTGAGTEIVPYVPLDLATDVLEIGESERGVSIVAERYGTAGGRRVLVIGTIHGDEDAGVAIIDELRERGAPDGIELWLIESMNPDGQNLERRQNANGVDLNRNFPYNWGPIGEYGDGQYAGPGPASEPETRAVVNFVAQLRPDITIWYHQDLFTISPAQGREGRVRTRYAELTGWPIGPITGGIYTGVAATWARTELDAENSVAFIVELGPTLSDSDAANHAEAIRTIASEGL